jgi:hypothetical protein
MQRDIVILADAMSAGLFGLTDLDILVVTHDICEEAILREAARPERRIVFVTEPIAPPADRLLELQQEVEAVLAVIPGCGASNKLGERMIEMLQDSVIGHNGT